MFRDGKYDLTIQHCREVLALEPDNVLALKQLGSAYHMLGRKQQAREVWKKALDLDPNDSVLKQYVK